MFGNRKLRIDLDNALRNNHELRLSLTKEEESYKELYRKFLKVSGENSELAEINKKTNKENEELKAKIRNQNEADLILISVKIIADILKGKKIEEITADSYNQRIFLEDWIKQQQQPFDRNGYGFNSLFSSLTGIRL